MAIGKRQQGKISEIQSFFSGPAHPVRAKILLSIIKDISSVEQIAREINESPPLVVYHLGLLKNEGWLTRMRLGRSVIYGIHPDAIEKLKRFTSMFAKNQ
jgi:DNA-binding transcriptional ArsR family regulator